MLGLSALVTRLRLGDGERQSITNGPLVALVDVPRARIFARAQLRGLVAGCIVRYGLQSPMIECTKSWALRLDLLGGVGAAGGAETSGVELHADAAVSSSTDARSARPWQSHRKVGSLVPSA